MVVFIWSKSTTVLHNHDQIKSNTISVIIILQGTYLFRNILSALIFESVKAISDINLWNQNLFWVYSGICRFINPIEFKNIFYHVFDTFTDIDVFFGKMSPLKSIKSYTMNDLNEITLPLWLSKLYVPSCEVLQWCDCADVCGL